MAGSSREVLKRFLFFLLTCLFMISALLWWSSVNVSLTTDTSKQYLYNCYWKRNKGGPIPVNTTTTWTVDEMINDELDVRNGGWAPPDCYSEEKIAIILPYRDREENLNMFLRHYHRFLRFQKVDYHIFVIEQSDDSPFNRAKLLNIGFQESNNYGVYNCFVFHDIDLLSEDTRNFYGCPESPRHMCPAVDKLYYEFFSDRLFGGVVAFHKNDFKKINGFSNKYWGWGCEDDDLYWRVYYSGMKITRPPLEIGRYKMLGHKEALKNQKAILQLLRMERGQMNVWDDGLTTLTYKKLTQIVNKLYIHITVDLLMSKSDINLTTLKKTTTQDLT